MSNGKFNSGDDSPTSQDNWITQLGGEEKQATKAFNELFVRYQPALSRYVSLFVSGSGDAREIIQRLFIRLWQKRTNLTGILSLESYLYRMARNITLNYLRDQETQARYEGIAEALSQRTSNIVEDNITFREYHDIAQRAIALLPERRRLIFLQSAELDRSLDEISKSMGLSRDVVKKQLYLAGRFIRTYLKKHSDLLTWPLFLFYYLFF